MEQLDAVAESLYPPSVQVVVHIVPSDQQALEKVLLTCNPQKIRHIVDSYSLCKINALAQNVVDSLEYDVSAVSVLESLGKICSCNFLGKVSTKVCAMPFFRDNRQFLIS